MAKRLYYGWFDPKKRVFRLSAYPPDAPVRPSIELETKADVMAIAERKKANVYWWPPLANEA